MAEITQELAKGKDSNRALLTDDSILETITGLFGGKLGKEPDATETEKLVAQAKTRYEKRIPPGWADEKKSEPERYGDYFVWAQLLEEAKTRNKPAILIQDDRKDDWWLRASGETFGARPELVKEFHDKVGHLFYMYTPDRFLEYAAEMLNTQVKEEAIAEVKELRRLPLRQVHRQSAPKSYISHPEVGASMEAQIERLEAHLRELNRAC